MNSKTLILGGARSGKSNYALSLGEQSGLDLVFVATAEAIDTEMVDRIQKHRDERTSRWTTIEEPLDLAGVLLEQNEANTVFLIDCLTVWLSNLFYYEKDIEQEISKLCAAVSTSSGQIVLVSNELGLGLVPETSLGRRFRDEQGRLNQRMAQMCDKVAFIAAGLPLILKG